MSTVPVAPKVVKPTSKIVSDSLGGSAGYGRPTSGGNSTADYGASTAPAGPTPGYQITTGSNALPGAVTPPTVAQPNATGASTIGIKGTVGDSGPGLGQ